MEREKNDTGRCILEGIEGEKSQEERRHSKFLNQEVLSRCFCCGGIAVVQLVSSKASVSAKVNGLWLHGSMHTKLMRLFTALAGLSVGKMLRAPLRLQHFCPHFVHHQKQSLCTCGGLSWRICAPKLPALCFGRTVMVILSKVGALQKTG